MAAAAAPAAQTKEPQIAASRLAHAMAAIFLRVALMAFWPSKPEPRLHRHAPHVPAPVTSPKVVEFTTVPSEVKFTIVEDIVRRNPQIERTIFLDRDRLVQRHIQTSLARALPGCCVPHRQTWNRRHSRTSQSGLLVVVSGWQNAAVLNHSFVVGLLMRSDSPGTTFARKDPLTPR